MPCFSHRGETERKWMKNIFQDPSLTVAWEQLTADVYHNSFIVFFWKLTLWGLGGSLSQLAYVTREKSVRVSILSSSYPWNLLFYTVFSWPTVRPNAFFGLLALFTEAVSATPPLRDFILVNIEMIRLPFSLPPVPRSEGVFNLWLNLSFCHWWNLGFCHYASARLSNSGIIDILGSMIPCCVGCLCAGGCWEESLAFMH